MIQPYRYHPLWWQAVIAGAVDLIILAALAAWAFSVVRAALRGEEVKLWP